MKLITAIINSSDEKEVFKAMMKGGFMVTKISSSGSILKKGVTTMVSAVHDDRVALALDIIKESTHGRKYKSNDSIISTTYAPAELPTEIVVGGATVFVQNIEQYLKF